MLAQPEVVTENREPFIIDSQEKAAWAMRKLHQIKQKETENTNTANSLIDALRKEIEGVQNWQKEQNESLGDDASYFICALEAYHRKYLEENPKAKTIKLPYGQLRFRAQQPEFQRDAVTLLAWVKSSRPDCVRVKEEADWATLKKSVVVEDGKAIDATTGEIIEGIQILERPEKFSVEINQE